MGTYGIEILVGIKIANVLFPNVSSIYIILGLSLVVCTYTALGGFKAVIDTEEMQLWFSYVGIAAVFVFLEPRFKTLLQRLRLLYGTEILFRREVIKQILERNRRLPEGFRFARIDSSDYDLASLYILNELAVILYFHLYFDPVCQYQISPLPMTPLLEILYDGTFLKDLLVPKKDIGYIEIMGEKDLTGRMIKVNTKGAPL